MKILFSLLFFATSSVGFASECLSIDQQKRLGAILLNLESAIKENPTCRDMVGAAACTSPIEEIEKRYYETRLKKCSKGAKHHQNWRMRAPSEKLYAFCLDWLEI